MISSMRKAALVLAVIVAACGPEPVSTGRMFEDARTLTTTRYMDDGYRAQAMGYWRELDAKRSELTDEQQPWVDFGIGILTMVDLVQGAGDLLDGALADESDDAADADEDGEPEDTEDDESAAISGAVAAKLLQGIRDNFLQAELVDRFERVLEANPNFEADFACREGQVDCMLAGNLDSGEILLFTGLLGAVSSLLEQVSAREGLIEFALDTVQNPPELDESQNLFRQLPTLAVSTLDAYAQQHYGSTFADSPMLTLKAGSPSLAEQQTTMARYVDMIRDGLAATEDDDNDSGEVFERNNYIGDILTEFIGLDDLGLADAIVDQFSITELREEMDHIVDSFAATATDAAGAYYFPTGIYDELGGFLPNPVQAHIPSIWLGGLFASDKQDWKAAFFPQIDAGAGAFYAQWEQEPYSYDADELLGPSDYEDVGVRGVAFAADQRTALTGVEDDFGVDNGSFDSPVGERAADDDVPPLGHVNPEGAVERPNGYVDPLYLFWSDGSFGGVLAPTVNVGSTDDPIYQADPNNDYANRNLNGLVSALLGLIADL